VKRKWDGLFHFLALP